MSRLRWLVVGLLAAACSHSPPPVDRAEYDGFAAVVDGRFAGADGAMVGGAHVYHTVGAALASLPDSAAAQRVVYIRKGRYHEKLSVDKPFVTLAGESRDSTIITFGAYADTPDVGGGTLGTRGSYTLRVTAPDFHALHLTIENSFNLPANRGTVKNTQAVAFHLDRGSDRAVLEDCAFTGWQDTVFDNAGRAYFHDCVITGQTDFIFGAGIAVFESCDIVSRGPGYITAPSTPPLQEYGFVFLRSRLSRNGDVADGSVALGRPWHPSSNPNTSPTAVFIECLLDGHISVDGWASMSGYPPSTGRFFEYESRGPGAHKGGSRRQLDEAGRIRYTVERVLGGWRPTA